MLGSDFEMNLPWKRIGIALDLNEDTSCWRMALSMKKRFDNFEIMWLKNIKKEDLYKNNLLKSTQIINPEESRIMATIGHGSYHHLSYGLCKLADSLSKGYLYIHIDHHIDSWRPEHLLLNEGIINCRNFVPYILEDTNAVTALFLGDNFNLLKPDWGYDKARKLLGKKECKYMKEMASGKFEINDLERLLDSVNVEDVYVTFDLDVMHAKEVITGYDRGVLSKSGLFEAIEAIKKHKKIIGADIAGYSTGRDDITHTCNGYDLSEEKAKAKSINLYKDIITLVAE